MGEKLLKYYELVLARGGLQGKMRLAIKTAIPSARAGEQPDSPENLRKFYEAAKEILGTDVPEL
jgi:hypothetical protein